MKVKEINGSGRTIDVPTEHAAMLIAQGNYIAVKEAAEVPIVPTVVQPKKGRPKKDV